MMQSPIEVHVLSQKVHELETRIAQLETTVQHLIENAGHDSAHDLKKHLREKKNT